jgi:hypothetical protein
MMSLVSSFTGRGDVEIKIPVITVHAKRYDFIPSAGILVEMLLLAEAAPAY